MIDPLIEDSNRSREFCHAANRILGQHNHSLLIDDIVNAVIDFRIQVIRTAGKNDPRYLLRFHVSQCIHPQLLNVLLKNAVRFASGLHGIRNRCSGEVHRKQMVLPVVLQIIILHHILNTIFVDLTFPGKEFCHFAHETTVVIVRHKRVIEFHSLLAEVICHVLVDNFRICSDNRTVVMIWCSNIFLMFVVDARIENAFDVMLY